MTLNTFHLEDQEVVGLLTRKRPSPRESVQFEYCAERDIGLVAFDPSPEVAAKNQKILNAALDAMHAKGRFEFVNGHTGPVGMPIRFRGKTFYFAGPILTGRHTGCTLIGHWGGQMMGESERRQFGGFQTEFVRIDPPEKFDPDNPRPEDCVLLVRCGGFQMDGFHLLGRRWEGNLRSGQGPKTGVGIGIEGRKNAPTSHFTFDRWGVGDCEIGVRMLDGFFNDAGTFIANHDMASDASWGFGHISNCPIAVRSDNVNAQMHVFPFLTVQPGQEPVECIFDLREGGNWNVGKLVYYYAPTLLRVWNFSPNANRIEINAHRDRGTSEWPTLFEYAGEHAPRDWMDWDVRIKGSIASEQHEEGEIVKFGGLPEKVWRKICFDVNNLEHAKLPKGTQWAGHPWRWLELESSGNGRGAR